MTSQDNNYWKVEDFVCFSGCPRESYEYMGSLLDDPANDNTPTSALNGMAYAHMHRHFSEIATEEGLARQKIHTEATDSNFYCKPYGYVREVTNTLPMMIREEGTNLVFQYEEWSRQRTVYMDGRKFPDEIELTPLGYSIGRYEGDSLVIETRAVTPDIFYAHVSGGSHSEQLYGVERYTVAENPRRLLLELTLTDPVVLKQPYVFTKTWVSTPDIKLLLDSCEDTPGQP